MPQQAIVYINIQAPRSESEIGLIGIVQPNVCEKGGVGETITTDLYIIYIYVFRRGERPAGGQPQAHDYARKNKS